MSEPEDQRMTAAAKGTPCESCMAGTSSVRNALPGDGPPPSSGENRAEAPEGHCGVRVQAPTEGYAERLGPVQRRRPFPDRLSVKYVFLRRRRTGSRVIVKKP